MKRTCLINILWVCYLFRPNTECKWLLTVPDSASRLGSGIVISFVCVCAASVSSFLWPSLSSFLFLSVFSLFVRASCTQGRGCVLKASLHTHQGGSLLFHTQTMTCTFYPAWLDGPLPASVSPDQMGSFIRRFFFFLLNAELRETFVLPVPVFFSLVCYQTWFYQVQPLLLHLWLWMIHYIPCRLVWAGCIICDKYWWVLSWGINFERV